MQFVELIAAVCFILALKGLSSPKSARNGGAHRFGRCADRGGRHVLRRLRLKNIVLILIAMAVGVAIGWPTARKVKMTAMPQLVALFNGAGGGAAALVATIEFLTAGDESKGCWRPPCSRCWSARSPSAVRS